MTDDDRGGEEPWASLAAHEAPGGRDTDLNLSKSGGSVSRRFGRRRLNTRGRGSFRPLRGLSWRFGRRG